MVNNLQQKQKNIKKEITIGQIIAPALLLLITVITAWITMNNKITQGFAMHDEQIKALQEDRAEFKNEVRLRLDKIDNKLDKNSDILIELAKKLR